MAAKSCHTKAFPKVTKKESTDLLTQIINPKSIYIVDENQSSLYDFYENGGREKISEESSEEIIRFVSTAGHHSVLEHSSFTFVIEGISRACSHQMVRHRIASFTQQSQRYVNLKTFDYIIPPKIANNTEAMTEYKKIIKKIKGGYKDLLKLGIPKEDIRYLLPNATSTNLIMTMNARSLLHFFSLRCCMRAQWEVREVANKMLQQVKNVSPIIFANAGAPCERGFCPEGDLTCGRLEKIKRKEKLRLDEIKDEESYSSPTESQGKNQAEVQV